MGKAYAVRLLFISIALAGLSFSGPVYAKNLDTEITLISGKLSKKLVARGVKKIASADFVDLQGRTNELGRYLAEQLSVEMVNEDGISVADRANIKIILAEHKLTLAGLVEPENARKLGKFAGIDAILTGTVTTLNGNVILTVKAISTQSAQIVAAAKIVFKNTPELRQLSARATSSGADAEPAPKTPPNTAAKHTKKAGPLVVTVDSVRPGKSGVRVFLTVDSRIATSLEVVKGVLIDSKGNELQIAHSMRTDLDSGNSNQITVEAGNSWNAAAVSLTPPFDLSLELGLAYGTMDAKTLSVSFQGLPL